MEENQDDKPRQVALQTKDERVALIQQAQDELSRATEQFNQVSELADKLKQATLIAEVKSSEMRIKAREQAIKVMELQANRIQEQINNGRGWVLDAIEGLRMARINCSCEAKALFRSVVLAHTNALERGLGVTLLCRTCQHAYASHAPGIGCDCCHAGTWELDRRKYGNVG